MAPRTPKPLTPEQQALLDAVRPWTPPPETQHRHTAICPWPVRDDPYRTWTYVRPGAPEDPVTDAERAAWVEEDPFIRAGLRPQTQAALAYITRFRTGLTK